MDLTQLSKILAQVLDKDNNFLEITNVANGKVAFSYLDGGHVVGTIGMNELADKARQLIFDGLRDQIGQ